MTDFSHTSTTDDPTTPKGVTDGQASATPMQDGPFAKYLADAPEDAREWASGFAKKIEGDTTKRFQEAAEFRKQWEPYAGVEGLTDIPADDLSQYLQLITTLDGIGTDEGVALARQIAELHGLAIADDTGDQDPDDPDPDADLREQIREELRQEMEDRFKPYDEARQAAEYEQTVAEQARSIEASLEAIDKDRGKALSEDQRKQVLEASRAFIDQDDPVKAGYQFWTSIVGSAEQGLVKGKQGEPEPAERGGQPAAQKPAIRSIEDATNALRERLAAERAAA